jgi:hypothetical protein
MRSKLLLFNLSCIENFNRFLLIDAHVIIKAVCNLNLCNNLYNLGKSEVLFK